MAETRAVVAADARELQWSAMRETASGTGRVRVCREDEAWGGRKAVELARGREKILKIKIKN